METRAANEQRYSAEDIKRQERRMLLQIFPGEIWFKILDGIDCPDDMRNCADGSNYFQDLLEHKRNIYIFPQVLQILLSNRYMDDDSSADILLKSRLVCKSWHNAVHNFYQNARHRVDLRLEKYYQVPVMDLIAKTGIHLNKRNVQSQMEKFLNLAETQNPFSSPYININYTEAYLPFVFRGYQAAAGLRNSTERFLKIFGGNFLYARILTEDHLTLLEWYETVSTYVGLMPNLKTLYISCPSLLETSAQSSAAELAAFPTLQQLEMLSLECVPNWVTSAILAANNSVKTFIVPMQIPGQQDEHSDMAYLTSLKNPETLATSIQTHKELQDLPETWNLKALKLFFEDGSEFLKWSAIFSKLSCYRETLTELYLRIPLSSTEKDHQSVLESSCSQNGYLDLPKVKICQFVISNYCSLDFLLGLKSLECLYLSLRYNTTANPPKDWDMSREVIDFNNLWDGNSYRLMQSNIWQLMPSLNKVQIHSNGNGKCQTFQRDK